MVDPITIGILAGLVQGNEKQRQQQVLAEQEATKELGSPWSGRGGRSVGAADRLSPLMQGAMAGWMTKQKMGPETAGSAAAIDSPGGDMQSPEYWDSWASGGSMSQNNTQFGPVAPTAEQAQAVAMTPDASWQGGLIQDPEYLPSPYSNGFGSQMASAPVYRNQR